MTRVRVVGGEREARDRARDFLRRLGYDEASPNEDAIVIELPTPFNQIVLARAVELAVARAVIGGSESRASA